MWVKVKKITESTLKHRSVECVDRMITVWMFAISRITWLVSYFL